LKVTVCKERCQGHAVCALVAPDVYTLTDEGYNRMDPFEVPKELGEQARKGANACPERDIKLSE
jgi:ferredoxin